MTFVAASLIAATATLGGAYMTGKAAKSAAQTSAEASNRAAELEQKIYQENVARQQPFLQTGTEFFNQLAALQRGGPEAAQKFLQMDPGYGFRFAEGAKALERSAAARGNLLSGNTGRALQAYGQNLASQEYGAAYNRLAGLANIGPQAAGIMSGLGQQYAGNVGNIYTRQGDVAANAALARGSAYQRAGSDISSLTGRFYGPQGYGQRTNYLAPEGPASLAATPYDYGVDLQYSDARLKTNVRKIDTRADGLGVYEFNYVWGGPKHIGLMAHEVQALYPDAVSERDGYLMVDYRKV